MMAYDSQFVLCVLHNGSPVREINGSVSLPFHSEYKVRLKNKHYSLRAKARVWIDGRQASNLGDFILNPGETLDLERFLDHSMSSGNRFKFVPLEDGRVNDPTDPENGIIKVEFYREKEWVPPRPGPIRPLRKGFTSGGGTAGSNWQYIPTNSCETLSFNSGSSSIVSSSINYVNDSAGATVEGGHSGQQFTYGTDFETDPFPVTLTLRLRGIDRMYWEDEVRPRPPKRRKKVIRFCPNCGARRQRVADHFCTRCGTAYHPRYENERGQLSR